MDVDKFVYPLTDEEQKAKENIAKLRARLKGYCEDKDHANEQYVREILAIDRCAVRWLFARGQDIEKAAQMFLDGQRLSMCSRCNLVCCNSLQVSQGAQSGPIA